MECKTFDELVAEVIKHVDLPHALLEHVMQGRAAPRLVPIKLPDTQARKFPVLRLSAILIESLPRSARRMTLKQATTSPAVRELLKEHHCRAAIAANGRELAVFGNDQEVLTALASLGPEVAGTVALDVVRDSWAHGLLYDALVRALSRYRYLVPRLTRSGHSIVVAAPREDETGGKSVKRVERLAELCAAYGSPLTGAVPRLNFPFQEGIFLKLEQIEDRWWCGFEPYTFVKVPREQRAEHVTSGGAASEAHVVLDTPQERRGGDPAGDWRRERWAQKYNKNWAAIIQAWAKLLTTAQDGTVCAFGVEEGAGIDAVFTVSPFTGWSRPGHHHTYLNRTK